MRSCGRALLPSLRLQSCAGCCHQRCSRRPQGGSAVLRVYTPLAAPDQACLAKVFQSFEQMHPGLESSGASRGHGVGWGWRTRRCPRWLWGDLQRHVFVVTSSEETVLGDLSQMESLLIFPGVFSLVLALGAVHQASILEEANNSDSYSLSVVWALHGARLHFRG